MIVLADMLAAVPPMPLASGGGIIFALKETTAEGLAVVLALAIGSIFSWSVMFTKIQTIRRAKKMTALFLKEFRSEPNPMLLFARQDRFPGSPMHTIFWAGCSELAFQRTGASEVDETFLDRLETGKMLSDSAMNSVRSAMERAVGESVLKLEDQMVLLATAVSGAPFLGLLGTVWGVMDAFSGVAQAGVANLQALAPGVSGALATTVMGLLVAIPAMFGYNFLVATIRVMTVEMDNFAAELASIFEHRYLASA